MEGMPEKQVADCAQERVDSNQIPPAEAAGAAVGPSVSPVESPPIGLIHMRRRKSPWLLGGMLGLLVLALIASFSGVGGCQSGGKMTPQQPQRGAWRPAPLPAPVKAVWVARFHYRYPDDIRVIMRNAAADGCNTVLWQVRGEGTVAYPSRLEPWSAQFDYRDPGYDPLRIAVAEAHRSGLRIEAWINVMPGWKGPQAPPINNQLWNTHPEWFLHDASGQRQPLGNFYAILNPCLPEVRRHIADVVRELISNYELDGIHLDYVRYAWDTTPGAREKYPRDPATLSLFRQETGRRPDQDVSAWDRWRAEQITRLVAEIRSVVRQVRPGATLTAAVWASASIGYRDYFQDSPAWLRDGLVDAIMPMTYTDRLDRFEQYNEEYRAAVPRGRIVPGVGLYKFGSPDPLAQELQRCRSWGGDYALFSYESLHATAADRDGVAPNAAQLRRMCLGVLRGR
jgi:uncharacterized lipoprotein YddW (UPF0748 family)